MKSTTASHVWEMGNGHFQAIKDEQQLLDVLAYDIGCTSKSRIIFLAGHAPLFYDKTQAYPATRAWGAFTSYSLELASAIAQKELSYKNKEIKFILLLDDINYEDFGHNADYDRHFKSRKRNAFYKKMSKPDAQLPQEFQEIFDTYQIPCESILRQNHNKKGRENCLFFSERILRSARQEEKKETECAKAYRGLLNPSYFNKATDYLLAFLPDWCTANICEEVINEINNFDKGTIDPQFQASHIAMQTDSTLLHQGTERAIWRAGVKYRRDNFCF